MAIIAIGALGVAEYSEVKYKFSDGETFSSTYSIHALVGCKGMVLDKTIVLLTKGARAKHWDKEQGIDTRLKSTGKAGKICDVDIKDGLNEGELWAIFDAIVENVEDNDELYIDITQALRHLPVLLLIACAYLRAARNVTIRSISYGAFELGNRNECDVLELLPYVALFDWSSATKAFQRSGDASVLAELLRSSAVGLTPDVSGPLGNVAEKLDNVTLALELARPEEASSQIEELKQELQTGKDSFKQYAKPFALLSDLLSTTFEKIGLPQTKAGMSSVENKLETQRNLIKWYERKKHLALSILLAREWLVSKHMVKNGEAAQLEDYNKRNGASGELGNITNRKTSIEMHNIWKDLHQVRNDIAHMGHDIKKRMEAKHLQSAVRNALHMLDDIK